MSTEQVSQGMTYSNPCNWWKTIYPSVFDEAACMTKCYVLWQFLQTHAMHMASGVWTAFSNPFDEVKAICAWYSGFELMMILLMMTML